MSRVRLFSAEVWRAGQLELETLVVGVQLNTESRETIVVEPLVSCKGNCRGIGIGLWVIWHRRERIMQPDNVSLGRKKCRDPTDSVLLVVGHFYALCVYMFIV